MQETVANGAVDKPFLTAKEAAHILGIHVNILYAWGRSKDKNKRPPIRRFGRLVRYPTKQFMQWAHVEQE